MFKPGRSCVIDNRLSGLWHDESKEKQTVMDRVLKLISVGDRWHLKVNSVYCVSPSMLLIISIARLRAYLQHSIFYILLETSGSNDVMSR